MAVILAYLFYFIAASASPLQRRWLSVNRLEAERKGQIDFAFKTTFVVALFSFILPIFQPFHVSGNVNTLIILAVLCGIFGAGFFISSYVAQKHVDAGITALVNNIYTPITIGLATVFLNEKLTILQVFGTLLLLFSIVLISKKHRTGRFHFDKYFLLMVASGVFLGILLTAERALQKVTGFTAGTTVSWVSQCLFLGMAKIIMNSKTKHTTKDISITGVLKAFQGLSWVTLIYVVGNLSIVSAVTTFKVVIVFIFAAIFLGEREDLPRKVIGSFIAVAGLLLMK